MSELDRGRLVRVEIPDPNGRNPKLRPAVVLSKRDEIQESGIVRLVAVSSQVDPAAPGTFVELPWSNEAGGHRKTRLNRKSFAICDWLIRVPVANVSPTSGFVPDRHMQIIQIKVDDLVSESTNDTQSIPPSSADPPPD